MVHARDLPTKLRTTLAVGQLHRRPVRLAARKFPTALALPMATAFEGRGRWRCHNLEIATN